MNSYVAAGSMPWKLIKLSDKIVRDRLVPYHIQLNPTNRCNGNCAWCSCQLVDRTLELPLVEINSILQYFHGLGARAITITGGGEPTIHPNIYDILSKCGYLDLDVGLVTNGLKWRQGIDSIVNDLLTWLRISIINTSGNYDVNIVRDICAKLPDVAVGISFTVVSDVNLVTADRICDVANEFENITHIRFVQDILTPDRAAMDRLVAHCTGRSAKAIFQYRDSYTCGVRDCRISLVKPVIDASGYVYPCCGVQYATDDVKRMPESFRMCYWDKFHLTDVYNGAKCKKCYYNEYNTVLRNLSGNIEHLNFI